MEKKFVINRVDLGQRVTGYEVFNAAVNGGEVIGMTVKQLGDAVKAGEILGMVLDANGVLKLDETKGFRAIMVWKWEGRSRHDIFRGNFAFEFVSYGCLWCFKSDTKEITAP